MEKRKIFYFFLAAIFIIIIYDYFTSIDNKEISTSETVIIKGTLAKTITKIRISRSETRLHININEAPNVKYYLSHLYFNKYDFKYRILPHGVNDSVKITTLKKYAYVQEGTIPIYSLSLNNKEFLSLEERNEIWKSQRRINTFGFSAIISLLIIIGILARLNVLKRFIDWYEKLNALR